MDFSGAVVNGLLTIVGYVVIFLGVYKVYQIATDIREIKDMLARSRQNPLAAAPLTPVIASVGISKSSLTDSDLLGDESASAYAEHLLRAVNAESQVKGTQTHEVR